MRSRRFNFVTSVTRQNTLDGVCSVTRRQAIAHLPQHIPCAARAPCAGRTEHGACKSPVPTALPPHLEMSPAMTRSVNVSPCVPASHTLPAAPPPGVADRGPERHRRTPAYGGRPKPHFSAENPARTTPHRPRFGMVRSPALVRAGRPQDARGRLPPRHSGVVPQMASRQPFPRRLFEPLPTYTSRAHA